MRIGEIVETCSVNFVAEGDLNQPPALGSLVKVELSEDDCVFAVVAYAQTGGLEPGRRAVRRGTEEVQNAAIYNEHPQLHRTLRTVFQAVLVGGQVGKRMYQQLPAQPPPLHYSVEECSVQEAIDFSDRLYYLRLLLEATVDIPASHLIVAHVNQAYLLRGADQTWLGKVARELSSLLKDENERLLSILYAIDPGI